jgi:hypothetical protein
MLRNYVHTQRWLTFTKQVCASASLVQHATRADQLRARQMKAPHRGCRSGRRRLYGKLSTCLRYVNLVVANRFRLDCCLADLLPRTSISVMLHLSSSTALEFRVGVGSRQRGVIRGDQQTLMWHNIVM